MNRRLFLQLLTAITSSTLPALEATAKLRRKKILVIGAGLAGLTAARLLTQRGHEVTVLEARNRIGGRIHTSQVWPGISLDLGATWIHGVNGNPLTKLAKTIAAPTRLTSYDSSIVYDTSGRMASEALEAQLNKLRKKINLTLNRAQQQDSDSTIAAAIAKLIERSNFSAAELQLIDFLLNSIYEQEYAGSVAQLSSYWFDAAKGFSGKDAFFVEGFEVIIDYLAKALAINLGQIVKEIHWHKSGVEVLTATDTYSADAAIVTLPLGVLKAGAIQFSPPLPQSKQVAIEKLGMGLLNKCYLRFPEAFWPTDVDWLEYIPASKGLWTEWVSFMRTLHLPVLLGFNAADQAREMEQWPDAQILDSAMETLRILFGNAVPQPEGYQLTRWGSDPFALGSYSFNAVGSVPRMRDQLAKPLLNSLYFAGEATERQHFSSANGAYLSGLRVARQLTQS